MTKPQPFKTTAEIYQYLLIKDNIIQWGNILVKLDDNGNQVTKCTHQGYWTCSLYTFQHPSDWLPYTEPKPKREIQMVEYYHHGGDFLGQISKTRFEEFPSEDREIIREFEIEVEER